MRPQVSQKHICEKEPSAKPCAISQQMPDLYPGFRLGPFGNCDKPCGDCATDYTEEVQSAELGLTRDRRENV